LASKNEKKYFHQLTLDDALEQALKNNNIILIQEQEAKFAKSGILSAKGNFLPKLNAGASYFKDQTLLSFAESAAASGKDLSVLAGYKNTKRASFSAIVPIYSSGANSAKLNQAQISLKIQQETLRAKKDQVVFEVKRLYYGLLLARQTESIVFRLRGLAKSHYQDVCEKFKQGTSSRFDVLQSKVQVAKLTPELINARNAVELTAAEFKKLLGFNIEDSLELKEKLEYFPVKIQEKSFLKKAYLNNPRMSLKSLGVDLGKWEIELAKSSDRPKVDAGFEYSFPLENNSDMFDNHHRDWGAGIGVTIPIFDAFSSRAKVEQAKSRYTQAGIDKEDLSRQLALEVRQGCLGLAKAGAVIESQKESLNEAREALRISQVAYDNGVGTNLDVLDSQVSLSQIEKNLSEGIYDYIMAQAFLDETMGE
jgi:outer membrane protein TolC